MFQFYLNNILDAVAEDNEILLVKPYILNLLMTVKEFYRLCKSIVFCYIFWFLYQFLLYLLTTFLSQFNFPVLNCHNFLFTDFSIFYEKYEKINGQHMKTTSVLELILTPVGQYKKICSGHCMLILT